MILKEFVFPCRIYLSNSKSGVFREPVKKEQNEIESTNERFSREESDEILSALGFVQLFV